MNGKNGKFLLKEGVWTRGETVYPHIAKVKPDPCFKNEELREEFKPNSFVHYSPEDMDKEKICDVTMYFANVHEVDGLKRHRIALSMLEFTKSQKVEIIAITHFPKSAFEKAHRLKLEPDFDLDALDPDQIGSSYAIFDAQDF